MKKLLIIFVLLIICLQGNPIDLTKFYINEVFIEDSSWVIELPIDLSIIFGDTLKSFIEYMDDTLKINTKSDSILYPVNKMKFFEEYCCIYSDSIDRNFYVDPIGDMLSIVVKDTSQYPYHSELNYGNIFKWNPSILIGASLCRENHNIMSPEFLFKYYTDLSPTIGVRNDSTGGCGDVIFNIQDKNGNAMPGRNDYTGKFSGQKKIKCLATFYNFYFNSDFYDSYVRISTNIYNDSIQYFNVIFPINYTSIDDKKLVAPQYSLSQNYPNPFNPSTTFSYFLPKKSFVDLSIYNIRGELIENLVLETMDQGQYYKIWNATKYSSGIYIYQLKCNDIILQKKCLFVK